MHKKKLFILFYVFLVSFNAGGEENKMLNKDEQQILLAMARDTVRLFLEKGVAPSVDAYTLTPMLEGKYGVFVTLRKRSNGELRGCVGHILATKPLAEGVIECAVFAATRDTRFQPMKKGEDTTVEIEISVLSPPGKIDSIDEIVVGRHGLIITRGMQSGVLLPQVPGEFGWDRQTYLSAICRKAGLPDGAWKDGARLYTFTAQVFGEKDKDHINK